MRHFACHWLAVSSLFLGLLARAETRPQYGGTLRVTMHAAPATLDPADSRVPDSFARRTMSSMLFDTLVTWNDGTRETWPVGILAVFEGKSTLAIPPAPRSKVPRWNAAYERNCGSIVAICESGMERQGRRGLGDR